MQTGLAQADFITPTSVVGSSSPANPPSPPAKLIDQSGLSVNSAAGTHDNQFEAATMWMTDGGTVADEWVIFDLGAVYDLTDAYVWQFNQNNAVNAGGARNVRTMDIYVTANSTNWTKIGATRTLTVADGSNAALPAETVSLTASSVRFVAFIPLTGGAGASGYVGLSEVRFEGTLVPAATAVNLPLSNAGGGTVNGGSYANVINDPFSYEPGFPGCLQPNATGVGYGFQSINSDAENYWYAQVTTGGNSLDYVDVWGNDNSAWGGLISRAQNLTLSFYTSTDASTGLIATSGVWTGPAWNGNNFKPSMARFDVKALIPDLGTRATIQSIKIDHFSKTEYLEIYEVRASNDTPPPPKGTVFMIR